MIRVEIRVADVSFLASYYDVIQVFRSLSGKGGPYRCITSASKAPASVTTKQEPFLLNNDLVFSLDSESYRLEAYGYSSAEELVNRLNTLVGSAVASTDGHTVTLTHPEKGSEHKLSLLEGWEQVDLENGDYYGTEEWILVSPMVETYTFWDPINEDGWYYFRLYNSTRSEWGPSSRYLRGVRVDSNVVKCSFKILNADGTPASGVRVSFVTTQDVSDWGTLAGMSKVVDGVVGQDGTGFVYLYPGVRVMAIIHGSPVTREFSVPEYDFELTEYLDTQDRFDVVVPIRKFVIRRSIG